MLLTRKELNVYLENMRLTIPDSLVQFLLERYGTYAEDDEGHQFEYTEDDVYEQIRKIIRNHQEGGC